MTSNATQVTAWSLVPEEEEENQSNVQFNWMTGGRHAAVNKEEKDQPFSWMSGGRHSQSPPQQPQQTPQETKVVEVTPLETISVSAFDSMSMGKEKEEVDIPDIKTTTTATTTRPRGSKPQRVQVRQKETANHSHSHVAEGDVPPIINGYKLTFFWSRFLETVLGGMHVRFGEDAIVPWYMYMVQLLVWIIPIWIGLPLAFLVDKDIISVAASQGVAAGVGLISWIIVQVWSSHHHDHLVQDSHGEDNDYHFEGLLTPESCSFLFPVRPSTSMEMLSVLLYMLIQVGCVTFLQISSVKDRYGEDAYTVWLVFSWLTVIITMNTLIARYPYEPAQAGYVFLCIFVDIIDRALPDSTPFELSSTVTTTNDGLHALFPFFMLCWIFAVLPPLNALFFWLVEQLQVVALGGTPAASHCRALGGFTFSLLIYGVCVLTYAVWSTTAMMTIALCGGVIGSSQVFQFTSNRSLLANIVQILLVVAAFFGGVVLLSHNIKHLPDDLDGLRTNSVDTIWLCVIAVAWVGSKLLQQFQHPFILRFFHNRYQLSLNGWLLSLLSLLHRTIIVVYIFVHIDPPHYDVVSDAELLFHTLFVVRALRWGFQALSSASIDCLVVVALDIIDPGNWWSDISFAGRFMLTSFVMSRLNQLCTNLWFYINYSLACWNRSKLRMRHSDAMAALCIVLTPIHLCVILTASLLDAPVITLLGAPIFILGFPRPLRMWPTLLPSAAAVKEALFYQHMVARLSQRLNDLLVQGMGALGHAEPGHVFLLRLEPYLLWLQVIERGMGHMVVTMKGLEFQQTSCHSVEASQLDQIVDHLEEEEEKGGECISEYALHPVRPLATVPSLSVHSVNTTSLVGVIDSKDTLKAITSSFIRLLLLEAHQRTQGDVDACIQLFPDPELGEYDLQIGCDKFPVDFAAKLFGESWKGGGVLPLHKDPLFRRIMGYYSIVELLGAGEEMILSSVSGPAHVLSVFDGHIPPSLKSTWLTDQERSSVLHMVLNKYRLAVKLTYDAYVMGELDTLIGNGQETIDYLHEGLTQHLSWYVGPEQGGAQAGAAKLQMFYLSQKDGKYFAHRYELQDHTLWTFQLPQTAVRSIWASLSLELQYFANDDDERYSIQAHPLYLRNLCVQAAEAPLGYAVYSTGPVFIPLSS